MSVEEKKFFMEYYFPLFRKLSKEKQTAVGLVAEGMRIAAGAIGRSKDNDRKAKR